MSLQLAHPLRAPQYRATQGCTPIEISSYQFEDAAHRLIIAAPYLLQHNAAHLLKIITGKGRCQQDFIDKLEGCIKPRVNDLCPYLGRFQTGTRALVRPQGFKSFA